MACRRINYPHDLLGVSETLQPDYPRIPPDHGWSTFSAMTHYLQSSPTFCGPSSLSYQKSPRDFAIKNLRGTGSTICSVMGYQHLAKLCRLMGCSATLLKPYWCLIAYFILTFHLTFQLLLNIHSTWEKEKKKPKYSQKINYRLSSLENEVRRDLRYDEPTGLLRFGSSYLCLSGAG